MEKLDAIKVPEYDFAISVEVFDKSTSKKVRLVTVYGPAHDDKKDQFLIELSNICAQNDLPLVLGGDFNILRSSDEKNKAFQANRFIDMFNWIINSYELREILLNGGKYTWSNNQADPRLERLDRLLMNSKWEELHPLTNLRKIPRFMSDHNPMLLCTELERQRNKK
jgi:exonuclease III